MYQVTLRHSFEAAHRLLSHQGKCRHLHGHSYKAIIVVQKSFTLSGMVVDFAVLKGSVGKWIDDNWDHNVILEIRDPLASLYFPSGNTAVVQSQIELSEEIFRGKAPFILESPPTAEVMAGVLASYATLLLKRIDSSLDVESVTIQETEKCSATYKTFNERQ